MSAKELRSKSIEELAEALDDLQRERFDHAFKHGTRQLTDTAVLRRTRREIAQMKTVLNEKRREAARAG